jgi:hypothetical protein
MPDPGQQRVPGLKIHARFALGLRVSGLQPCKVSWSILNKLQFESYRGDGKKKPLIPHPGINFVRRAEQQHGEC